jgi:hypothetical protein
VFYLVGSLDWLVVARAGLLFIEDSSLQNRRRRCYCLYNYRENQVKKQYCLVSDGSMSSWQWPHQPTRQEAIM